jgi:TonB-dependent starch-binding outer membrane protein SusC
MKKKCKGVNIPFLKLHFKIIRFMKVSLLLTLVTTLNVSAVLYSQDSKLNLTVKDKSLIDVIRVIEQQSNYRFFFSDNYQDLSNLVSINVKDGNIDKVLTDLFEDKAITYKMLENNIIVITPSENIAQQQTVTGTVTDATSGEALPGVNIIIDGTTNGVITDINGKYSITVDNASATLVFSFIGYVSEKIAAQGNATINVALIPDVKKLDEVVVVGYGTQRAEAVTGSVSSIRGDVMRDVPSSNITTALQGRVAGVDMSQTSTKPGAQMQIRIRGSRSLSADNNPLVVLDGIPFAGSIGDINPNDIKSVDILKDASATAIYGSRGANGVLLVTTNKGQKGQKSRVSYNGYYGAKKIFAKYPMMDGPEFIALRAAAGMYTNGQDEADDVNTDWQDLFYRPAMVTSHDLGISGGTEKGSYNFGLGYYRDEALIPGQDFSRYSMSGSLDLEIAKNFRFGFTTKNNYSVNNGNNMGLYGALSMSPISDPYNADGTWKRTIRMPLDEQWSYSRDVIENLGDKWIDQSRAFGSYNNIYGEVKIPGIEGLKYRAMVGANFRMSDNGSYTGEGIFSTVATTPSTATISHSLTTNWVIENLLSYDRTFAQKHQVNIVALYSAEQTKYNRSQVSAKDIPVDAFQFYNLGQAAGEKTIDPNNQDYQVSGLMSYMGRVMYSYDNRYMISATIRSDASSRLAEGHKWHTYPAVSVGWNIKNEAFMKNITQIDMLKLRFGYGQTSNQAVAPYATLGRLSTRPYNFGTATSTGYYVSTLPNPNLGWEYSKTMNYGLDFSILNHRLSGTIEYYVTDTKDILLNVNLPSTSGVSSYTGNIGQTQNKGVEVSLNGVILDNLNGWTWEAGINFYANRNKLVALSSGQERDENNWWFVGHPIDVIYDYEKIGLWQTEDPYLVNLEGAGGQVGQIKVKYTGDYDANGVPTRLIGPADRQIMSVEPDFQGGFNTRVAYKGFDITVIGAFKSGGILNSTLYSSSGYLNLLTGRRGNVKVDYWTPENTGAKYPKPGGPMSSDNPKYGSTLGYFDASYLKIRAITLGYDFNQKWMKKMGVDKLRIYCTVQNPFVLFSPYFSETGQDPETNSYGNENAAVALPYSLRRMLTIGTNSPSTRNYLVGINLTF